jgi:hypothetical protein
MWKIIFATKSIDFWSYVINIHIFYLKPACDLHCQYITRFENFTFLCVTCRQIWLSPLVDDCNATYLTKLTKKTSLIRPLERFFWKVSFLSPKVWKMIALGPTHKGWGTLAEKWDHEWREFQHIKIKIMA